MAFEVVFAGPSARLTLAFEAVDTEGWRTATVAFDAQGLHSTGRFSFFPGL